MMRLSSSIPSLVVVLALMCCATVAAQDVIDDISFGHKQSVSPNSFAIPGWSMLGEGHVPQLLSDKVILTPPYGGHRRGALWAEKKNSLPEWTVDFDFRAGGTDRGSGNLQLWYANNGKSVVSTSSIYTVGQFDGLAIAIDTNGGVQKIRGFLNDGTIDYKSHQNVDSLAFGHCDYVYRNLGRPSQLNVRSTNSGLEVKIDGETCFATDKVSLPIDYHFGITAASADPPDSFEVFKFVLTSAPTAGSSQGQFQQQARQVVSDSLPRNDDRPASQFTTSETQFEDLHNRLNQLSKSIANLFTELTKHTAVEESRFQQLLSNGQVINSLDGRVANLERVISNLEHELKSSDHKTQFAKLSEQIAQTHVGVTEDVPQRLREYVQAHTPRIGFILYSFMAFQTCCIGAFAWYKWRKSTMPKKYL